MPESSGSAVSAKACARTSSSDKHARCASKTKHQSGQSASRPLKSGSFPMLRLSKAGACCALLTAAVNALTKGSKAGSNAGAVMPKVKTKRSTNQRPAIIAHATMFEC